MGREIQPRVQQSDFRYRTGPFFCTKRINIRRIYIGRALCCKMERTGANINVPDDGERRIEEAVARWRLSPCILRMRLLREGWTRRLSLFGQIGARVRASI